MNAIQNRNVFDSFKLAISYDGKAHEQIVWGCNQVRLSGGTQSECSSIYTAAFKEMYPGYDFTHPENNSTDLNRRYANQRKAISRFWNPPKPKAAPAPQVVAPTTAPPTPAQVAPAVVGIAQAPVDNASAPPPQQMTLEALEELVLTQAQLNPAWGKQLISKLVLL